MKKIGDKMLLLALLIDNHDRQPNKNYINFIIILRMILINLKPLKSLERGLKPGNINALEK